MKSPSRSRSRSPSRSPPARSRSRSPPWDPNAWRSVRPYHPPRRPIAFVRSSSPTLAATFPAPERPKKDFSSLYLSIVGTRSTAQADPVPSLPTPTATATPLCEICSLPIIGSIPDHEMSLAHQAALPHSHPPHPYPRSSIGLRVLEASGWDPDERVGLGKEGEGTRYPIKTVEKLDRGGIGLEVEKGEKGRSATPPVQKGKIGIKEARKVEEDRKRMRERIRGEMTSNIDWSLIEGSGEDRSWMK